MGYRRYRDEHEHDASITGLALLSLDHPIAGLVCAAICACVAAGARFIPKDAVTGDTFARFFAMLFWIGPIGCLIASAIGFCLHFARTLGLRLEAAAKSARRGRHGFPSTPPPPPRAAGIAPEQRMRDSVSI